MNETELKKKLGLKIKEQRNKLNLTQELFSEKIGITQRQMSLIELGKSFPSPKTLSNIVKIAECSMSDLFDFEIFKSKKEIKDELRKNLIAAINSFSIEKLKILYTICKNI